MKKIIDTKGKDGLDSKVIDGNIGKDIIVGLLLPLVFLFSCSKYTEPTAIKQTTKANDKYPESIAKLVRGWYPCTITETNTVIETRDSIVYVDCPDLPQIIHEPGDTVYSTQTVLKTVKVPVHLPVEVRYITKWVEDSAKIFVLNAEVGRHKIALSKLQADLDTMTDKRDYWRFRFFILLGIVILYAALKIYSKRFSPLKNLIP